MNVYGTILLIIVRNAVIMIETENYEDSTDATILVRQCMQFNAVGVNMLHRIVFQLHFL